MSLPTNQGHWVALTLGHQTTIALQITTHLFPTLFLIDLSCIIKFCNEIDETGVRVGLGHTQKFSKMKTEEIDGKGGVAGLGGGVVPREQYSHHVKRTTFYGVTS